MKQGGNESMGSGRTCTSALVLSQTLGEKKIKTHGFFLESPRVITAVLTALSNG